MLYKVSFMNSLYVQPDITTVLKTCSIREQYIGLAVATVKVVEISEL